MTPPITSSPPAASVPLEAEQVTVRSESMPEALVHWLKVRDCWPYQPENSYHASAMRSWLDAGRPGLTQQYALEARVKRAELTATDAVTISDAVLKHLPVGTEVLPVPDLFESRRYAARALNLPNNTLDNVARMMEQYALVYHQRELAKIEGNPLVKQVGEQVALASDLLAVKDSLDTTTMMVRETLEAALQKLGVKRG